MKIIVKWMSWWLVTMSFAVFLVVETAVIMMLLRSFGIIRWEWAI